VLVLDVLAHACGQPAHSATAIRAANGGPGALPGTPRRECLPPEGMSGYGDAPVIYDEATMREVGRRLSAEAPEAQVVLFGSHARGSATPRSDIDVLVIEPEVENTALESVRLMRAVRDLRLPIEVVVVSEQEAAEWRDVRGSLIHAALAEGRVLAA
jgi:predicted nucleotidyltransferase